VVNQGDATVGLVDPLSLTVPCAASDAVGAIDLAEWNATGTVRTAEGADGLAWAGR
jgi:hypothetical protein